MRDVTNPERRVVITGAGVLTTLGDSPAAVHQALCEGRNGLRPAESIPTDGLPKLLVGELTDFDARAYLGSGNLRPLDRAARLSACAARLALDASGWPAERVAESEVGLVLGTMFGSIHTISEFDRRALEAGPNYVLPMSFANSVINAAAGQTAIWHDLRGVNATVSGGAASGLQALAYAADLIRNGRSRALLAGGMEELCFESLYGFYRAGWLSEPADAGGGPPVPFHARRTGFALAEAAALLVLEDAAAARERGASVLGEIRGHGSAIDCSRGDDPEQAIEAIRLSIRAALEDAHLEPGDIDCLSLSASGSPPLDGREAGGIAAAFGSRAAELPVTAVKSMLGEALGASGALQTVLLIEAMQSGHLPGIRGLDEVEQDFPLAQARPETRQVEAGRGLVLCLGLAGQICAVIVEQPSESSPPETFGKAGE
jgi:3-oxoacyl-[acyl-carrier-protein] synthase II